MRPPLAKRVVAELAGTALLLAAVVGSGIMGQTLAGENAALALLANTLATGAALVALILAFGPVSGAHFNPAVTLAAATQDGIPWREVPGYLAAQVSGALLGVGIAHVMFGLPVVQVSTHSRGGAALIFSELVATFGLLATIWGCARRQPAHAAFGVGAYITAAYWFTASTSFANPAVTIARTMTDTFSGISPANAPAFVIAQLLGALSATLLFRWLAPVIAETSVRVVATDGVSD